MNDTGVIDRFLAVFSRYIDSGFGLLGGEVSFIATTLIVIDVTLAILFWTWAENDDVLARLVKKTLFIGTFSYIISNWNALANIIFDSFAGLGLKAAGGSMSAADLLRPGHIAQVGLDAGRPILEAIGELMGYISFFENFLQIAILLLAWLIVLLSFFILAIQLFVTLIEFKLTTLAGFILIPFGLFGKTAFLAERVLGNVVSSGIKVLVLAVIVGIGSTLFAEFTAGFAGAQPTLEDAAGLMLAALSLLGLGIFGPGIANGIVSGGPQLGAGAAVGTGLAAGGVVMAGAAAARMAAGAASNVAQGAVAGATQLPTSRGGGAGPSGGGSVGSSSGGSSGGSTGASEPGATTAASSSPSGISGGGTQASAPSPSSASGSSSAPSASQHSSASGGSPTPWLADGVAESSSAADPGDAATGTGTSGDSGAATISSAPQSASTISSDAATGGAPADSPVSEASATPWLADGVAEGDSSGGTENEAQSTLFSVSESAGSSGTASAADSLTPSGGSEDQSSAAPESPSDSEPEWAKSMRRRQALTRGVSAATHAVRAGDSRGAGASIDLSER